MDVEYKVCLRDYESLLPDLAKVIEAEHESGSFTEAEERFHAQGNKSEEWVLQGKHGRLTVLLEKYEGYYFSRFNARQL